MAGYGWVEPSFGLEWLDAAGRVAKYGSTYGIVHLENMNETLKDEIWGFPIFETGISVYHIFHEASQFLPEIASNRRKNFRIMMPEVGKRLGGSLSHITLHPTYGASKNPRTNHYIDWFK
jgi:hypothetical protein